LRGLLLRGGREREETVIKGRRSEGGEKGEGKEQREGRGKGREGRRGGVQ